MARYNTTQLYIDRAMERGIVHRDYIAHCLRWTHVLRHAHMGQRILDVGCGINTPLAWTMYTNKFKPEIYVGLDYRNNFETKPDAFNFPIDLIGNFDVTSDVLWDKLATKHPYKFEIVTCFEVLEHMPKYDGELLLQNLSINSNGATVFLSTPVFNGSKAANHIHEWEYLELWRSLDPIFHIDAVYGTFASQVEILSKLTVEQRKVFDELRPYYDSNLLSILFAPMHPEHSRNCIWRLRSK